MLELLTQENFEASNARSCDPDYNVFVCGPELGDSDGCEPESEAQMCGPDYDTDCMPECHPAE